MADYEFGEQSPNPSRYSLRAILMRDWPYIAMLGLALFGVAYTNFARQAMTGYWMGLAPVFGLICVILRWQDKGSSQSHARVIVTQALHWAAVVFAMYLVFVADVRQMMSEIATSLMVLTVLALGTFTAGIHIAAWRVCAVGIVLGLGVPVIAWFEERTILVLLLTFMLLGIIAAFFVVGQRRSGKEASF
ncbi:MAG TPA: hypothetical protein VMU78_09660 [Methylocella sp.]|nr:hypothetical protein [Methylocella sp.]